MRNQVIIRPRQQLLDADLNNFQGFTRESFDEALRDGLGTAKRYTGFLAEKIGPAEIRVAPGLLYLGGPVHGKAVDTNFDTIGQLPVAAKKKAAIVGWGTETETDVERRNFRTDVTTNTVEPQDVAVRRARVANIDIVYGQESASPQLPPVDPGYVTIATVDLSTTGVDSVVMNPAAALKSTQDLHTLLKILDDWRAIAEPLLSTLRTDLAALAARLRQLAGIDVLNSLVYDVALLKERAGVDEDAVNYGADHYLIPDEIDLLHAQSDCRVEEGLRFNWDGVAEQALALFNPLDPLAKVDAGTGQLLPKYTEHVRLAVTGFAGDVSMSQYASQQIDYVQREVARRRIRYGDSRKVCTNNSWWRSGSYNPANHIFTRDGEQFEVLNPEIAQINHRRVRLRKFWVDEWTEHYWEPVVTEYSVNGALVAQTALNAQGGWYLGSTIQLTQVAADGDITMLLCETLNGAPDVSKVIASVTVPVADLKTYPEKTRFGVPPVYLERGKRYARVFVTQGDHRIALADRNAYLQGSFFVSTDGAYLIGDLEKDVLFEDLYAKFVNPRSAIEFTTVSLAGGVTDLDLLAEQLVPDGTTLAIEVQPEGQTVWTPLDRVEGNSVLYNKPALVRLRAIFLGTSDDQPMIKLTGSRLRATRSKAAFTGVSEVINLGAASDTIAVTSYLEHFDEAKHDCTLALIDPGDVEIAASVIEDSNADRGIRRKATFSLGAAIGSFRIKHTGTAVSDRELYHLNETVWHAY